MLPLLSACLFVSPGTSFAVPVDLTGLGSSATINEARFFQFALGPSGTGTLDTFVRYQRSGGSPSPPGTSQGFNTDGAFQYDEKSGNFTHSIRLNGTGTQAPVALIELDNILYRQFVTTLPSPADPARRSPSKPSKYTLPAPAT